LTSPPPRARRGGLGDAWNPRPFGRTGERQPAAAGRGPRTSSRADLSSERRGHPSPTRKRCAGRARSRPGWRCGGRGGTRPPAAGPAACSPASRTGRRPTDIDLDATVARIAGRPVVEEDDIVVRERISSVRSVVLLVDVSGSMRGERVRTAAATVGALAAELSRDNLAVIAFGSDAAVLCHLGQRIAPQALVESMVRIPARGLTNVCVPLHTLQMGRPRARPDSARDGPGTAGCQTACTTPVPTPARSPPGCQASTCCSTATGGAGPLVGRRARAARPGEFRVACQLPRCRPRPQFVLRRVRSPPWPSSSSPRCFPVLSTGAR